MKLAVVVPSRGLLFSQTAEELLNELKDIPHKLFITVGKPLPECFNAPVNEALEDPEITHILICEDDMIIPKGVLKAMIKTNYAVVALDYPFKGHDATTLHAPDGSALYTGTGFMLINRLILDKMEKPYFRTDIAWDSMITKENEILFWPRDVSKKKTYGLHDVHFGILLFANQIPICVPPVTAGQRKLVEKGNSESNMGIDSIKELRRVWRNNTTKNESPEIIAAFLKRINQLKSVKILTAKPENVYYKDGQARIRGEHVVV